MFMNLDLRNAYHLVRIKQGHKWRTIFNNGYSEYLVMPFGLTNAPAGYQALVKDVLCDMLNKFVFVLLDPEITSEQDVRSLVLNFEGWAEAVCS